MEVQIYRANRFKSYSIELQVSTKEQAQKPFSSPDFTLNYS